MFGGQIGQLLVNEGVGRTSTEARGAYNGASYPRHFNGAVPADPYVSRRQSTVDPARSMSMPEPSSGLSDDEQSETWRKVLGCGSVEGEAIDPLFDDEGTSPFGPVHREHFDQVRMSEPDRPSRLSAVRLRPSRIARARGGRPLQAVGPGPRSRAGSPQLERLVDGCAAQQPELSSVGRTSRRHGGTSVADPMALGKASGDMHQLRCRLHSQVERGRRSP